MEHKLAQKAIEKKDEKRMSEDTPSSEDGPDITYAALAPWTPYPFNSGQPRQHTAHIFEIPSLKQITVQKTLDLDGQNMIIK